MKDSIINDKEFKELLCNKNIVWIVLIAVICLCGSNKGPIRGWFSFCKRPGCEGGSPAPVGGGNIAIWIVLAILLIGNGGGGNDAANMNTNIINVDNGEDDCCFEEESDCCHKEC